ncbi:MAG: restriction endonuclease subunit S [Desulfobulbus sp.]|jgi:type I restriction enzyme S subunit
MTDATRNLLEQHFDTAFAAPDGIARLRELILTLAMQGKLVKQDPNDPSASELLKEIEAEKQRLVEAGKIKKPKPLPPIKPEEVPYELPQGWEWVRLGDICSYIQRGKGPKYVDVSTHRVISQKCVRWYGLDLEPARYIDPASLDKYEPIRFLRVGDLLWNSTGTGTIGRACLVPQELEGVEIVADSHVTVVRSIGVRPVFLWRWIQSPTVQNEIEGSASGTTNQIELNTSTVINHLMPLPPIPEQHRIVARIDQLMARCDALEKLRKEREEKRLAVHAAAIKQLLDSDPSFPRRRESSSSEELDPRLRGGDEKGRGSDGVSVSAWDFIQQHFGELYTVKENVAELRKAILQLAVMGRLSEQKTNDESVSALLTNVHAERQRLKIRKTTDLINSPKPLDYEIPEQWKWVCLDDVLIFGPTNGFSPRAVDYETNIRSLTLSATTSGTFKGEYSKFIDADISNDSDLWLRDGDILVQRGNTIEYVGVSAVYRGNPGVYVYPDLMMKLRVSSHMDTDYVYYAMSSVPAREYLRAHASGTSGTMPKINQKTLKSLPIPVPPLEEQHRIVVKIKGLMDLCEILDQQIDDATGKQTELLNAVMAQV